MLRSVVNCSDANRKRLQRSVSENAKSWPKPSLKILSQRSRAPPPLRFNRTGTGLNRFNPDFWLLRSLFGFKIHPMAYQLQYQASQKMKNPAKVRHWPGALSFLAITVLIVNKPCGGDHVTAFKFVERKPRPALRCTPPRLAARAPPPSLRHRKNTLFEVYAPPPPSITVDITCTE